MEQIATYLLIVKFKAKDSEIVASPLCSGNISKDWSADNMKKAGLNGYVYEFNVDYRHINKSDIANNMPTINLGLTILSDFTNANSLLNCISMKNQECKVRPEIINVNSNEPVFYPLVLKQVNVAAVVIILMIRMQKYVFPML